MPWNSVYRSESGKLVNKDHGCGCCGDIYPATPAELDEFITELESELATAKELRADLQKQENA